MAFVADDLAAWLIGWLADAGRKKLTTLVLGTDQERDLRQAAVAAVQRTARQLCPSDDEQAEHVALVISQVFCQPLPDASTAAHQTILEALQAGIATQLAILDDASITGTEQSSADVLGVPRAVLAEKLTVNLLREIVLRGSQGGAVTPLAAQLNHDMTHIQGERLESMLSQLIMEVSQALRRGDAEPAKATDQQQRTLGQLIPVVEGKPSWVGTHASPLLDRPRAHVPTRTIRELIGHRDMVNRVVFSPDGTLIATGSMDRTARLWHTATGTPLRTLAGPVSHLAFSPDGTVIVTACGGYKTVRLWDVATGTVLRTLTGQSGNGAAFRLHSTMLATVSNDATVELWDASTGMLLRSLTGQNIHVLDVAFAPTGTMLATAGSENTADPWARVAGAVRLWDSATGTEEHILTGHSDAVCGVAFSPDGTILASASADNTVRLWDVATGIALRIITGHTSDVFSVAFSPDGSLLATASRDWTVRLWETVTLSMVGTLAGHTDSVTSVAFSPDGSLLASASQDRMVRLWG
jgi:WD40 repeat protein